MVFLRASETRYDAVSAAPTAFHINLGFSARKMLFTDRML